MAIRRAMTEPAWRPAAGRGGGDARQRVTVRRLPWRRVARWPIVAAGVALAATGACGGGDTGASSRAQDGTSLTAAQFRSQANEICTKTFAVLADLFPEQEPSDERKQEIYDELVVIQTRQLDDLDALTPPPELADEYDSLIETGRENLETLKSRGRIVLDEQGHPFEPMLRKAADLDLRECSEVPEGQ